MRHWKIKKLKIRKKSASWSRKIEKSVNRSQKIEKFEHRNAKNWNIKNLKYGTIQKSTVGGKIDKLNWIVKSKSQKFEKLDWKTEKSKNWEIKNSENCKIEKSTNRKLVTKPNQKFTKSKNWNTEKLENRKTEKF